MIYPGNPVHYKFRSHLRGLEGGELVLQPKWDGRRAVYLPGDGLYYKSGKPVDARPWKDLAIPPVNVVLDLELMRDRAIVLDVIATGTLDERLFALKQIGITVMSYNVSSLEEVRHYFDKCIHSGICDGVVLKRRDSKYPMCTRSQLDCIDWVKVKQECNPF